MVVWVKFLKLQEILLVERKSKKKIYLLNFTQLKLKLLEVIKVENNMKKGLRVKMNYRFFFSKLLNTMR